MDIKILKNSEDFNCQVYGNQFIIETEVFDSPFENFKAVRYYLLDVVRNRRTEILPDIHKYDIVNINDCVWESQCLYFSSCESANGEIVKIKIIKYSILDEQFEEIYTLEDDLEMLQSNKRYKIFVLGEFHLLIQQEFLRYNLSESYSGFFDFELYLYSIKEHEHYNIVDENLKNNGIECILPVSSSVCVIKTGYSLLIDNRYTLLEQDEVSVEGISYVNIQQFISDMLLIQANIVLDTIDQAYFNSTFPYVFVKDGYMVYSKVNLTKKEEEVIFYNFTTKDTKNCINKNAVQIEDIAKPYIIEKEPYIRLDNSKGTEFLNLNTSEVTAFFSKGIDVNAVNGNFFIVTEQIKKGILRKDTSYVIVYKYPQMTLLHREKGEYLNSFVLDEEDLYVVIV